MNPRTLRTLILTWPGWKTLIKLVLGGAMLWCFIVAASLFMRCQPEPWQVIVLLAGIVGTSALLAVVVSR
jgi:hypothetical protein